MTLDEDIKQRGIANRLKVCSEKELKTVEAKVGINLRTLYRIRASGRVPLASNLEKLQDWFADPANTPVAHVRKER